MSSTWGPLTRAEVISSSSCYTAGAHAVYRQVGGSVLSVDYTAREYKRLGAVLERRTEREDGQARLFLDLYNSVWKRCKRCGKLRRYDEYYLGRTSYCKECMREMQRERIAAARAAVL